MSECFGVRVVPERVAVVAQPPHVEGTRVIGVGGGNPDAITSAFLAGYTRRRAK